MLEEADAACERAAEEFGCTVEVKHLWSIPPIPFDERLIGFAKEALGTDTAIPSGPLHDAAEMARLIPTVMVFSKSSPPVSHTAEEDTPEADLKVAIEVYGKTVDATLVRPPTATCLRASEPRPGAGSGAPLARRRARAPGAARPRAPRRRAVPPPPRADPRLWDYLPYGPFADAGELRGHLARHAGSRTRCSSRVVDARPGGRRRRRPTCGSSRRTAASRSATSGSAPPLQRTPGGDGDDLPARPPRLRRPRQPPAGVEVRRRQRALAPRGRALRLHLRGRLPPAHDRQGPQPRHGLVLDARRRVAGGAAPASRPGWSRRTSTPRAVSGGR